MEPDRKEVQVEPSGEFTLSPGKSISRWINIICGVVLVLLYADDVARNEPVNIGDVIIIGGLSATNYYSACHADWLYRRATSSMNKWIELMRAIDAAMPHMGEKALSSFFLQLSKGIQAKRDGKRYFGG